MFAYEWIRLGSFQETSTKSQLYPTNLDKNSWSKKGPFSKRASIQNIIKKLSNLISFETGRKAERIKLNRVNKLRNFLMRTPELYWSMYLNFNFNSIV